MTNKLVEEYKELYVEQVKKDLMNEGFEINEIINITNNLNEHFEEDLLEKTVLKEVVPIEEALIKTAVKDAPERKSLMTKVREFASKHAKAIGVGIALAGAAFLLYKAIKRKFDACANTCRGDKKCLYNCKINYQKGLISVLKRNEQELEKEGKLTYKRKISIEKALYKAKEKIKKYQEQLRNLK